MILEIIILILILGSVIFYYRNNKVINKKETNLLLKMEEYYNFHFDRLKKLKSTLDKISISKSNLNKDFYTLNSKLNKNKFFASESQKQNSDINKLAYELTVDSKTLDNLKKELNELSKREEFLSEYEKSYRNVVENLRYTIDSNKKEYERNKELAEVYNEADEFLNGSNNIENNYQNTLKEYEQSTSLFTSQIIDFENRRKPMINQLKFEEDMKYLEGFDIIENYNQKLKRIKDIN